MPVYEYEGKHYDLPEGLSNEQAIAKIEAHLKGTTVAQEPERDIHRDLRMINRGAIRGASIVPNAVLDGIAGARNFASGAAEKLYEAATGTPADGVAGRLPLMSEVQAKGLDGMQYDGKPFYPQAVTTGEKVVQGAAEALAGTFATPGMSPANMAQAAAATAGGAAAPAAYDKAMDVTDKPLVATAFSLLASMAAGKVGGAVGGAAGKLDRGAQPAVTPTLTIEEVERRARASYQTMEASGVMVRPLSARNIVDQIEVELRRSGYRPNNQPEVATALQTMRDDFGQARVSFYQLDEARKAASALKSSTVPNVQRLGATLIREFDSQIARLGQRDLMPGSSRTDARAALEALESARSDWRALSKASLLDDVLNAAELRAAKPSASESELIRDGFLRIATNKKLLNQFDPEERAAIIEVTRGIPMDRTLGLLAKMNPARSQLAFTAQGGGAAGALAAGQPGLAAIAGATAGIGFGADKAQSALRRRQAEKAVSDILNGRAQVSPEDMSVLRGLFGGTVSLQER
jgi:hypothetical protein